LLALTNIASATIKYSNTAHNILITAQNKLNQDLITIINALDVHSLSQLTSDNFSYHDYAYWSGSLSWNTYLTYLYWQNHAFYLALTEKSNHYYNQYLADAAFYGSNTTRVYQEAAVPYLATLHNAGITHYTAQEILPKYELWQYMNSQERIFYIQAIHNYQKQEEVWLMHQKYLKEYQAEEDAARELRDQQQQETENETSYTPPIRTDDIAQEQARIVAEQRMIDQILDANAP